MPSAVSPKSPSRQYWLDRQWIHDHYAQLVSDHANGWVAVHCGRVLASGNDLGAVEDAAPAQWSAEGIMFQFVDDGLSIC